MFGTLISRASDTDQASSVLALAPNATAPPIVFVRAVLAILPLHPHIFRDKHGYETPRPREHAGAPGQPPRCETCGPVFVGLWCPTIAAIVTELSPAPSTEKDVDVTAHG